MRRTFLILCLIALGAILFACQGSLMYREKHGLIKELTQEYEILTIRVDDDAEYHITAINKSNGTVKSISDADYNGYKTDDISILYSNIEEPILRVKYDDRLDEGYFTESIPHHYNVLLPYNFKISTFDD